MIKITLPTYKASVTIKRINVKVAITRKQASTLIFCYYTVYLTILVVVFSLIFNLLLSLSFEIRLQNLNVFVLQHTAENFGAVIESDRAKVNKRAESTESKIGSTENHALDSGIDYCSGAHSTGLHSDVKSHTGKPPSAESSAGTLDSKYLRVMSSAPFGLSSVVGLGYDLTVPYRKRAYGHLVYRLRDTGELYSTPHKSDVILTRRGWAGRLVRTRLRGPRDILVIIVNAIKIHHKEPHENKLEKAT